MANLILKASSGNSLVVQGGDASPAITVGNTGTTTFAENATLSGTANNLGTVTAGTIGPNVVFPSGHVVGAYAIPNSTKTTIADNTTYTWGTFDKQQGTTTKLIYSGVLQGHGQVDRDASGFFISFESSSRSQTKDRTVAGIDVDVVGSGHTHLNVSGVNTVCTYAETYTVKWGTDTASSNLFTVWNPDSTTEARYNGARNSVLLIWEVVI